MRASRTWCSARTTTRPSRCTGWPPRCCRCSGRCAPEWPDGAARGHGCAGRTRGRRAAGSRQADDRRGGRRADPRRRHLTVSRPLACYEIELFLATGALDRIVTSWVGIGLPWGLAPIFRHYTERGEVCYDEWSHLAMGLRYKAGAMGVPFLPSLTMLGSDLAAALDLQTVT